MKKETKQKTKVDVSVRFDKIEREIKSLKEDVEYTTKKCRDTKSSCDTLNILKWIGLIVSGIIGLIILGGGLGGFSLVDEKAYCEKMINASYPNLEYTVAGVTVYDDSYICNANIKNILDEKEDVMVVDKDLTNVDFEFIDPEGVEYLNSDNTFFNFFMVIIGTFWLLIWFVIFVDFTG